MCEVKGGCTCGNETCCMDDGFTLDDVKVESSANDRKVFYIEVKDLPPDAATAFINNVMEEFKKGL